jgi:rhodanese-related sulfurtransferase
LKGTIMAHEITVSDLALEISDNAWVLDVREIDEWNNGHVPTAHHIPLNSVPDQIDALPREGRIFVICASGGRSMTAADFLVGHGFDAVSVGGGTNGWVASGREVSFDPSN